MKVRFEPLGAEIDCSLDETVLDAAFRHGYNLAYGCREGQCSACKCFLVEGDVALKPYSSFALSDSEQSSGYSLMCRATPERDLLIELLHYDPDNYRLENPIRDGVASVSAIESLTDDIFRVVLDAPGFTFTPGQFVDVHVDGHKRSFSMANRDPGRIELIVKRYPGGRFSGKLDGQLTPGDEVGFTGPYGALRVRDNERSILMLAAGSGIAPILSLLRQLEATGCGRPVRLFFASRTALCAEEIGGLKLADFRVRMFPDRSMLEAVDKLLAAEELVQPDVYMCGPPPMLEAAEEMLIEKHKIDEQQIFQDKFTTAAEADPARSDGAEPSDEDAAVATKRAAPATNPPGDEAERQFSWYIPRKRRPTLYEDVTVDTQPSVHRHLRRGWPVSFEDGRGTWDEGSTALRSSDWFEFRDPGERWERPYYRAGTAVEDQIEGATRSAREEGLIDDFRPEWVDFLRRSLQVPAYVEHGLWFALATAGRDCLSDSVSTCVCLQAAMKQRSAQAIVLYAMDLEEHLDVEFPIETAREAFLHDEPWQPTRQLLERLAATTDWGEVVVAANLCFEPIVATLLRRELGTRAAAANGDTVTPVLARVETQEWEWARAWTVALVRFLLDDARNGAPNRAVLHEWVNDWLPRTVEAALALGRLAAGIPTGIDAEEAIERVQAYAGQMLEEAGLPELCSLVGYEQAEDAVTEPTARRTRPRRRSSPRPGSPPPAARAPARSRWLASHATEAASRATTAASGATEPAASGPAEPAGTGAAEPTGSGAAEAASGAAEPTASGAAEAASGAAEPTASGAAEPTASGPAEPASGGAEPTASGAAEPASGGAATDHDRTYHFVGIVMAKSAEGDAVARILGERDDVVVHDQPAFWDIRAKHRLVIPYEEISEELGYELDAYSIQHEMSTHYGRMVATDDALMLFSDPAEAMEHLMSI